MAEKKSYFALWAQVDPSGPFEFLTCVGITGNVAIPEGDVTITYCPSVMSGQYEPDLLISGEKGPATLTLVQPLEHVFNWTLELRCPANLRLNYVCGADRVVFGGYRLGVTLIQARRTTGTILDPTALEPGEDGRVMTNADFSALLAALVKKLDGSRQGVSSTTGVNDIDFLSDMCWSDCSIYTGLGQEGYAVLDSDYAGPYGDTVLHTVNSGGAWTPTTTSPFAVLGRNAMAVKTRWIGNGLHRVIVAGGAMAATYPEISYSDDEGVVWYNVNPGLVGGQGINQMCWDQAGRLWAVATGGYIYVSTTQGQSWATSEAGVETTEHLNDIVFYNANVGYAVGNANDLLRTTDGGVSWDLVVGPSVGQNLLSCCVNRYGHLFVSNNAAEIWRSLDRGATWTEIVDFGSGSVNRLRADPLYRYHIAAIWDNVTNLGALYRSENGGYSFDEQPAVANLGLDALCVCDQNTIFVGGEPVGGTSFIARYIRQV